MRKTVVVQPILTNLHPVFAGAYPKVMGILNVTPDSFYDGGFYFDPQKALDHARKMVAEGVDIIDIGGESTRPNAQPISIQQECDRVLPIIEQLKKEMDIPLSLDSRNAEVIEAGLAQGVDMINDVTALTDPRSLKAVAKAQVPVCLMHMQGLPQTMQQKPQYQNVVEEIYQFLAERIQACEQAGIGRELICVDPGFGFGKTLEHNLTLLANLSRFNSLNCPLLIGLSRKSMFKEILQAVAPEDRLFGTLAASSVAAMQATVILRTHDVAATHDLAKVIRAIKENNHSCP